MTYKQVYESLPADAVWSCSFGYPGEGGFVEYFRQPNGTKWIVSNGSYLDCEPFNWQVRQS